MRTLRQQKDQYIYGVPGKIAGEGAEAAYRGGNQAVEVALAGGRELWDLAQQEIEKSLGDGKK